MFCTKCGFQLPDNAQYCLKCGTQQESKQTINTEQPQQTTKELKCPSCGAPISPKFGEMVITCDYCGSSVTLENAGWKNITSHKMLPINIIEKDDITARLHKMMDHGLLHRHLQESSTLEELNLTMIPYWVIPVTAKTNIIAADIMADVGSIATTAALVGIMGGTMGGGFGSRRGGMGMGLMDGMLMGSMMGGMSNQTSNRKAYTLDNSYNCPVIALKALTEYQPHDYQFALDDRIDFDAKKIPKSVKILNGDINGDSAKNQAKIIVDRLQSDMAHSKYHMIQQMETQEEASEGELLHAPIWFAKYDHKGKKIILIIDANTGGTINSFGL